MNDRVVIDPQVCHGKPTIKGTRIMVSNVLGLLAGGYSFAQVTEHFPELTHADVKAAIEYAAASVDDDVVLMRGA